MNKLKQEIQIIYEETAFTDLQHRNQIWRAILRLTEEIDKLSNPQQKEEQ